MATERTSSLPRSSANDWTAVLPYRLGRGDEGNDSEDERHSTAFVARHAYAARHRRATTGNVPRGENSEQREDDVDMNGGESTSAATGVPSQTP